ncbi:hypothetical protein EI555_014894, partial [Monodon monoceros]
GAAAAAAPARKEPWQPTDPSSLLEMAGEITEPGELYSPYVGLVYMFNLIVGTGALTMPKAFAAAGWLVSLVLLVFLGFMSFVTTTFVVEAMAAANAQLRWKRMETHQEEEDDGSSTASDSDVLTQDNDARAEKRPILSVQRHGSPNLFEITDRVEMGQMASMFFSKVGVNLFYFCIITYLYGDLAIYAAAVPFSLMQVTCSAVGNDSCGVEAEAKYNDTDLCWGPLHRVDAYRIYLTCSSAWFGEIQGRWTFALSQKLLYNFACGSQGVRGFHRAVPPDPKYPGGLCPSAGHPLLVLAASSPPKSGPRGSSLHPCSTKWPLQIMGEEGHPFPSPPSHSCLEDCPSRLENPVAPLSTSCFVAAALATEAG